MAASLDVDGLPDNVTVAYGGTVNASDTKLAVVDVSLPVAPQVGDADVKAVLPDGSNVVLTGAEMELRVPWSAVAANDGSLDEDTLADYAVDAVAAFAQAHSKMGTPGDGFDNAAEQAANHRAGVAPANPGGGQPGNPGGGNP